MAQHAPFGLEHIYDYEAGGHHPVHLGDLLGPTCRYRVVHKSRSGGFGNVWMCRDLNSNQPAYVAVKSLIADETKDDCSELHVRTLKAMVAEDPPGRKHISLIEGPNGSHLCFVYPILGPSASRILKDFEHPDALCGALPSRPRRPWLRCMNRAFVTVVSIHTLAVQAIANLTDFTPSNILLRTTGLSGLSEHDLIQILGEPRRATVTTMTGVEPTDPSAPKYLV